MPRGDGTGPDGKGPRTGRGLGYCSGSGAPGYVNNTQPRLGQKLRRSFGRGRGARRRNRNP